ncbi:MAG: signal recognition particle protein [Epsilonproteobacteria bacterium]|nr:signal recognition particle protein [Campylobacterota bacterium]NPA56462.1 signal recognition particle protein [Campylobacterota bacterium]
MFETISNSLSSAIKRIRFRDDEKALKKALTELKKSLLKADVHHKVVKELLKRVELETKQAGIGRDNFLKALQKGLTEILEAPGKKGFVFAPKPPTVVLMTGLQGSGKTTTAGKLAYYLKLRKKKVLLVAADLQRLAAVEQLRQLAQQIEVDIYADEGERDPVAVVQKALSKGREELYDAIIIDTAGRLAIDEKLMEELRKVKEVANPDEVFYVADSLTGQDAVRSASRFNEEVGITGVILTKFDGDSKGGVALSIAHQIGVPLRFIGTGEKMPDLETFIPERIVGRLMGAGDIESLAEKTAAVIDEKKAKELNKKIAKGKFNFEDFLEQLESIKKMGNLKSLISMIPGMGNMAKAIKDLDLENSQEIKKIKAMINSMTPKERKDPDLVLKNSSRKRRIAKGAGLSIQEVNKILKQFNNAAKFAKKFAGKKGMQDLNNMMKQLGGGPFGGFPR